MSALLRGRPTAPAAREASPAKLFDAHAGDLLALANLLLDDRRHAGVLVAEVLRAACLRPRSADDRSDRRNLAEDLYRRSVAARAAHGTLAFRIVTETCAAITPGLDTLSDQQRSVIGMCLFGGHTHGEAAQFLTLPVWVVDELLRSGLHRLSSTTPW